MTVHTTGSKIAAITAIAFTYLLKFLLFRHLTELDACLSVRQSVCSIAVNIGAAFVMGALTVMPRRRWLGIALMLLTDLWLLFNAIYFLANRLLPDWQVITLAPQLRGFESSLLAFLDWRLLLFPLLSVAGALFMYAIKQICGKPMLRVSIATLACGVALQFTGVLTNKADAKGDEEKWSLRGDEQWFMKSHSPIGHAAYAMKNAIAEGVLRLKAVAPLTDEEERIMATALGEPVEPAYPKGHLVFILVESLETWALEAVDVDGKPVCPNITSYIAGHTLLYCPRMTSQQQYGRSGDGQLITQTGLLPLKHGVACIQYGGNVYPNLAHFYSDGVVINGYAHVWNQRVTTYSYGFKRLIEPRLPHQGSDRRVLEQTRQQLENADTATCVLALTIDTHAPFGNGNNRLAIPDGYSKTEAAYLRCVSRLDSLLGDFLAWADTAQTMRRATIVITADHNHFPRQDGKGLCPLIINSPEITKNIRVGEAWQMDVFPTVLHAIGQQGYCWQGFGIDLIANSPTDTEYAGHSGIMVSGKAPERTVTPAQALTISDKLIRSDYFKNSVIDGKE